MPWSTHENITSIVMNFLGGQQAGNAIADVLFGVRCVFFCLCIFVFVYFCVVYYTVQSSSSSV